MFLRGDVKMLAKYWKQIGFIILIIAVLFNITLKLINKTSLKKKKRNARCFSYPMGKNS